MKTNYNKKNILPKVFLLILCGIVSVFSACGSIRYTMNWRIPGGEGDLHIPFEYLQSYKEVNELKENMEVVV